MGKNGVVAQQCRSSEARRRGNSVLGTAPNTAYPATRCVIASSGAALVPADHFELRRPERKRPRARDPHDAAPRPEELLAAAASRGARRGPPGLEHGAAHVARAPLREQQEVARRQEAAGPGLLRQDVAGPAPAVPVDRLLGLARARRGDHGPRARRDVRAPQRGQPRGEQRHQLALGRAVRRGAPQGQGHHRVRPLRLRWCACRRGEQAPGPAGQLAAQYPRR
ncbi:hypothetical protein ON010_g12062 [Phytophthora cinnamomi]|nr:hypothetical protein ON010_g12062 [Phytophthora cinnamomi]